MIVLVRHNCERTYPAFVERNLELLRPEGVLTFTAQPFSATLRVMLAGAVESAGEWFVTLDADVLLDDAGPIRAACERGLEYADFHVIDKFRGRQRGGPHMYSRRVLQTMLDEWPAVARGKEFHKRPEGTAMRHALATLGVRETVVPAAVGRHDFGQWRRDLFYKYVYRGWRTLAKEARRWFAEWEPRMTEDADFCIVRAAIEWSWLNRLDQFSGGIRPEQIAVAFQALGIAEKAEHVETAECAQPAGSRA